MSLREDILQIFKDEREEVNKEREKVDRVYTEIWTTIARQYSQDLLRLESNRQEVYPAIISDAIVEVGVNLSIAGYEAVEDKLKADGFTFDILKNSWVIKRSTIDGELNDENAPTLTPKGEK